MRCKEVVDMLVGHIPKDRILDAHLQECKSCMQVKRVVQQLEVEGARLRREDLDTARIQATRHAAVSALNEQRMTTALPWILRPVNISLATAVVVILGVALLVQEFAMPGDPAVLVKAPAEKMPVQPVKAHVAANIDSSFVEVQAKLRTTLGGFRERHRLTIQETSTDPNFKNLRNRLAIASEGFASERRTLNMLKGSGGLNE